MTHDVSIVTAFFDIGRAEWQGDVAGSTVHPWSRRSDEQYLAWFDNLARLKNQIVIFTESQFAAQIQTSRQKYGLETSTTIMICDDLLAVDGRLAASLGRIEATMRPEFQRFVVDPAVPENWNARYVMLNMLKPVFACTAIELGLVSHEQVAWIDFGYCRDDQRFDPTRPWRFDCQGRMNLFHIREPDDRPIFDIVRTGDVYFQGCHLVGPAPSWFSLRDLMGRAMTTLLESGLVDDDQTAILMAYRRSPDLFRIHPIDPADWFVVLRKASPAA